GREEPTPEQAEGAARPPRSPLRARAREAAGRARRDAPLTDRLGRARGEDPDLQLPRESRHRSPDQAHGPPARPGAPGCARRVHGRTRCGGPPPRARRVTVRDALADTERRLAAAGIETPRVDAEWLVAHVLGVSRSDVHAHDELDGSALESLVARREHREPLAYVLGDWGFRRLTLKTDARALVPRPETEVLVERALALI